jgi:hypothetical protein
MSISALSKEFVNFCSSSFSIVFGQLCVPTNNYDDWGFLDKLGSSFILFPDLTSLWDLW